ncbi:SCY1-like protein 2 [Eumeta japonica]|uniref:SCY1-like protein 2 n=1 Tax=Eumeta variegata TaxID=151549 RepID=A0A4C1WP49_EUMVA|nr:SCY1-like protein 2 [Eumeta japonica]
MVPLRSPRYPIEQRGKPDCWRDDESPRYTRVIYSLFTVECTVASGRHAIQSNTVSQLSGVLPGNPVTREFEAIQHIASAGPGLQWKIYKGYKKSTKQEASIFVFEKKALEKWNKADREIMLEILRRGVSQLTKLRHPQILTVQHSLEESRESLAFATEPVFASLANIIGNTENMPQPVPKYLVNYKLYDLEIKYGLMQIAEGLSFLHNDVKLLHHNGAPGAEPFWPFAEYCQAMHPLTQPVLDFLAPDTGHQTLGNLGNDYLKFKRFASELKHLSPARLSCIAEGLKDYVKLMLNATPELRPDTHQFLKGVIHKLRLANFIILGPPILVTGGHISYNPPTLV